MGLFAEKTGVVMGIANSYSIATAVANYLVGQGADLGFSHLPDREPQGKNLQRLKKVVDAWNPKLIAPCDAASDASINEFFDLVKKNYGQIDFIVHSIAFAPLEDIRCATLMASREGFKQAMDISVYSLIAVARAAQEVLKPGGSILTMTYFGGEKVVAGYNLMGLCKAALDSTVRYLAYDLGEKNIRVNAISAGPLKTAAASAVGDFGEMLGINAAISPLGRNISKEDVAGASAFLLSDLANGITGEILHVDAGYNIMGGVGRAFDKLGINSPFRK